MLPPQKAEKVHGMDDRLSSKEADLASPEASLEDIDMVAFKNTRCFFEAAFARDTVVRAVKVAAIVGTILTAINQGDMILAGVTPPLFKILLTYCVPYCVSTYSAASFRVAFRRRELGLDS